MKLRKLFLSVLSAIMIMALWMPTIAKAQGVPAATSTWKVLVLVLPDVALVDRGGNKQVTTMHYGEIEKVKQMASDMEKWSTHHINVDVDVKVDYEDVTSSGFGHGIGHVLSPGNIQSQIDRNVAEGEYDSMIVVYRAIDEQGWGVGPSTQYFTAREKESKGATYSTLPLNDADHSMSQFDSQYPERRLLRQALDSVQKEVRKVNPNINYVPYPSDPIMGRYMMMEYMHSSTNPNDMANNWDEFLK